MASSATLERTQSPIAPIDVSVPELYSEDRWQPLFAKLRAEAPIQYVPAMAPGFILRTSAQLDPVRCCRTTVRPLMALFDSLPVPALPSVAVNVTTDPVTTEVRVAVIVSRVGMSRQVLYSVLLVATS